MVLDVVEWMRFVYAVFFFLNKQMLNVISVRNMGFRKNETVMCVVLEGKKKMSITHFSFMENINGKK